MRHTHRILSRQKDQFARTLNLSPGEIGIFEHVFYDLDQLAARIPQEADHLLSDMPTGELYATLEALRAKIGMCSQYEHTHYLPVTDDDLARLLQIFVLLAQDMRSVTDYRRQYSVGDSGLEKAYARIYQKLRHAAYGSSHVPASVLHDYYADDVPEALRYAEQFPTYADAALALHIYHELPVERDGPLDRLLVEDLVRLAASAQNRKHPSELIESDLYAIDYVGQAPDVPWATHMLSGLSHIVITEGLDAGVTESTFLKEADTDPRYRVSPFARPHLTHLPSDIARIFERKDYGLSDET